MKDEQVALWDQYAMEFYKARVNESTYWTPSHLAEKAYEYASAMMREREARLFLFGGGLERDTK